MQRLVSSMRCTSRFPPLQGLYRDAEAEHVPVTAHDVDRSERSAVRNPDPDFEMHRTAEYGIAAHWKYKESADGKKGGSKSEEEKLSWLRQVLDWQMSDNREFMSS